MLYYERYWLLAKAYDNDVLQQYLYEKCRRDICFWINHFCWTYDPRKSQAIIPFKLYPYQAWFVEQLVQRIESQDDWGVEKSRDMGVSWLIMLVVQHGWLFKRGWSIHVGSRREAEVDTGISDPSSLFGKFRFNLLRLPRWMRPSCRERKLSLLNLNNLNHLSGESANPSFSRGQRHRCVIMDEFAFWDCADMAYGAASETTRCRGVVSTPYGSSNRFAQLMLDENNIFHDLK